MALVEDSVTPEIQRMIGELTRLSEMKISVGIQGDADSTLLMIAGVHEYGATIRAKRAKNLAIPISPKAKGKSPRDFDDIRFQKFNGVLYGIRDIGKDRFEFLFMLLPSVKIPERSFIRASYDNGRNKLEAMCERAAQMIIEEGKTAAEAADYIGMNAVAMTKAYFENIQPPKGRAALASQPDKTQTLRVTGRLINSITYEVSSP